MKGCEFMYTKYFCSYCNKELPSERDCRYHEMVVHGGYNSVAAAQLVDGKNPCDFCSNAYYVYGCEFDCGYKLICTRCNGYAHFVGKDVDYGQGNRTQVSC